MHTHQFAEALTGREQTILRCLSQGLSNQEIADQLHLSLKTVKWYNTQIFDKLGVKNRAEAIRALAAAGAAPVAATGSVHLPTQLTPFVGRATELSELVAQLCDSGVRILTIIGPGGMGKTRLAIETGVRSASQFSDGVIFVSLANVETPTSLVLAVAGALKLHIGGAGEPARQLFDFVRDQSLLLILDNAEQLGEAALCVAELIQQAPRVKVLLTSREKLRLSGELVYALGGLATPVSTADCLSFDAIALFVQHARRVNRSFAPADLTSLVRIAQLTQGMPLALVLAAAWADVLSPAQIADEISCGIDILERELRDAPARHRSIRAVCDATWAGLSEHQQQVFMRLCVFLGGFTYEAAQVVAGIDLPMLSVLASKSLIQPQANRRYTIHALLRQYSAEHLSHTGAVEVTHAAHSAYFLDFLARRTADVMGRRQEEALLEIDAEYENIRTAWLWALSNQQYDALDGALDCLALGGEKTGRLLETSALLHQTADTLPEHKDLLWERVAVRLARLNIALRDYRSVHPISAICQRARERGDAYELAWCLRVLGEEEVIFNGSDQRALPLYEELIDLCRATGNEYHLAHGLTYVSWRYANSGQVERAVAALREGIAIRRRIGDVKDLAHVTAQLFWMTFDLLDDPEAAEALLDEQIAFQEQAMTTPFLPGLFGIKAMLACWRGEFETARRLAGQGVELSRNQNYLGGRSICQGVLGMVEHANGDYAQAEAYCREVLASSTVEQTAFLRLWGLSLARYQLGDAASSRRLLVSALRIARRYRSPTFQAMCLLNAAVTYLHHHDVERGVMYLAHYFSQPVRRSAWLQRWALLANVRAHLQATMGAEAFEAAWAQGQAIDVSVEAARVQAELAMLTEPHHHGQPLY
jgi:predicted ATPase/DNA-binding CsgD family transcriptional regulator